MEEYVPVNQPQSIGRQIVAQFDRLYPQSRTRSGGLLERAVRNLCALTWGLHGQTRRCSMKAGLFAWRNRVSLCRPV